MGSILYATLTHSAKNHSALAPSAPPTSNPNGTNSSRARGCAAGVGRPCDEEDGRIEVQNALSSARNIHLNIDTKAWDKKGGQGEKEGDDYAYEYADRDGTVCEAKEPRSA